jgi:hypothetical protein
MDAPTEILVAYIYADTEPEALVNLKFFIERWLPVYHCGAADGRLRRCEWVNQCIVNA